MTECCLLSLALPQLPAPPTVSPYIRKSSLLGLGAGFLWYPTTGSYFVGTYERRASEQDKAAKEGIVGKENMLRTIAETRTLLSEVFVTKPVRFKDVAFF